MINNKNVCAIVVTYNPDIEHFQLALKSILSQVNMVIIVDNNSSSQSDILMSTVSKEDNIRWVGLSENVGLAKAQNMAIKIASEERFSHVVLFDQDSILSDKFICSLVETETKLLEDGYNVAAVGPSFFDPVSGESYPATRYRGPFIERVQLDDDPIEATFIIASGSLIRIDVLDKIGHMLDSLFIDYIDVEWSLRARSKGYSVFIAPQARMAHTIGDRRLSIFGRTISVHSPLRRYYLVRNSILMLRLGYVPFGYKLRELFFNVIRTFIGFLTAEHKIIFCKYFFMALHDGFLGRSGPCPKIYKS